MKKTIVKVVAIAMLLSAFASLLTGCFLKTGMVDGPGMVNYPGILLAELVGDWESDDGSYRIKFWEDYTLSLSHNDELLLVNALLTLYTQSADPNEYSEFDVDPNSFTDAAGSSFEIANASHENGTVTLELAAADGTKLTIAFNRVSAGQNDPELLDGSGMYYYGGILDDAITGCWYSTDGRFVLDFNGKSADFSVDGVQLASKDDGYFVDHSFSEDNQLNERCELYPMGNYMNEHDEPPLTIDEMWYQAEHIYMLVTWPDGKTDEIVLNKQDEAMPEGEWKETPEETNDEAALAEESSAQSAAQKTITIEAKQGDGYMTVTFNALPATFEEFTTLAEGKLQSPENTCALFLLALNLHTADKDAGAKAIDILRGPRPMNGYDTQFIHDRLREKAYLPLAYFDGATPENNYTPAEPYTLQLYADTRPQDCEDGYIRLFLKTTGADSTRPIKLRQKDNEWFLWEYSSVLSGIRIPAAADPWA